MTLTAETVGQKLNTKNLVRLKVAEQLSRNDSLFRAQAMLSYAGRHSWGPVCICVVAAQNEEAGAPSSAALRSAPNAAGMNRMSAVYTPAAVLTKRPLM